VSFDWRLWRHDIHGSIVHAMMLHKVGLLTKAERDAILKGLEGIGREIQAGKFRWKPGLEDVHMNIEAELTRRTPAGAKLHTGAVAERPGGAGHAVVGAGGNPGVEEGTAAVAGGAGGPGWEERGGDDAGLHAFAAGAASVIWRIICWPTWRCWNGTTGGWRIVFRRLNVCPLGSGAIAGSTLPLDREMAAQLLGFVDTKGRPVVTQNSMDAVSDRDFAVEFCAAAALIAVHLSRLAEDVIFVGEPRVWVHYDCGRVHDGVVADAAEEEPGYRGIDAGQDGAG